MDKQVMVVGIDDSDHSFYALEWTLDHFILPSSLFKLVVVHSKPTAVFAGPGAADVLPLVDSDLKKIAARVIAKAKDICHAKSGKTTSDVLCSRAAAQVDEGGRAGVQNFDVKLPVVLRGRARLVGGRARIGLAFPGRIAEGF